ncbi:glutathione S-transferase family protein [Pectobacterium actinidiae]|uniref:glutathione S-transferase family protein n=1 Tax=Pectobacterium actinidiae TaxID=1507808 RepID=UPI00382ECFD3
MIIYDTQRSGNAWKVRLMAGLLGVELERRTLSIDKGELRTDHWQQIAPLGQVPLLELDNGERLAESFAILYLLAHDTAWWPRDVLEQAKVLCWLSFEQERHMKPLAQLRLHLSLLKDSAPSDPAMLGYDRQAREALDLLENQLSSQGSEGWVASAKHPTIADVALFPYTKLSPLGGIELSHYPKIQGWLQRIEALPGYQPLFPGRPELTLSTAEL